MEVKCYNKKCLHIWFYRGKEKKFVCCPKCRFKRLLSKCRAFFLNKSDIPNDIQSDRPTDIQPLEAPIIVLKDLKKEKIKEEPKLYPGFKIYTDQFGEKVGMREVKSDLIIRTIPRDPIKLLEHQESFL